MWGGLVLHPVVSQGERWVMEGGWEEGGEEAVGAGANGATGGHQGVRGEVLAAASENLGGHCQFPGIWNKGYSNFCWLCTTIVKAISVVAAGLVCRVDIVKITRCWGAHGGPDLEG